MSGGCHLPKPVHPFCYQRRNVSRPHGHQQSGERSFKPPLSPDVPMVFCNDLHSVHEAVQVFPQDLWVGS